MEAVDTTITQCGQKTQYLQGISRDSVVEEEQPNFSNVRISASKKEISDGSVVGSHKVKVTGNIDENSSSFEGDPQVSNKGRANGGEER